MPAETLGAGIFKLSAPLDKLQKDLGLAQRTVTGKAGAFGAAAGKVGAKLTRTLTPAAAAMGVVFRQAGKAWHDGSDAIIEGTGASGKALADMQGIMKRVSGTVPESLGEVGTAIAELNTRLGLTGKPLETMTRQMLELARVSGTDVKTVVADTTRLFGDWSVKTKDQAATLDKLFAATQQTGVGLDRLTGLTVQYGAPLRLLGFNLDQAISLFGKWEKEGVNVETVMGGMRQAVGRLAGTSVTGAADLDKLRDSAKSQGGAIQKLANDLKDAKAKLEDALKPATQNDVTGATQDIAHARLGQAEATQRVAQAEKNLNDLRRQGGKEGEKPATALELRDAQLSLADAKLGITDADLRLADAESRLNEVKAKGTNKDADVIAARAEVTAKTNDLAAAEKKQTATLKDLANGEKLLAGDTDLVGMFRDQFASIRDAKNETEALAIGMKLFGRRGGADVVKAIREGRFEIDDLVAALGVADGSIDRSAKATLHLSDRMAMMRNKVSGVIGPMGDTGMAVAGIAAGAGPAISGIATLGPMFTGLIGFMGPLLPVMLAIGAAFLIYELIKHNWDKIKAFFSWFWQWFQKAWDKTLKWFGDRISGLWDWFLDLPNKLKRWGATLVNALTWPWRTALNFIIRMANKIPGVHIKQIPEFDFGGNKKKAPIKNTTRGRWGAPVVSSFDRGGISLTPGVAMVDANEMHIPAAKAAALNLTGAGVGTGGAQTVVVELGANARKLGIEVRNVLLEERSLGLAHLGLGDR